MRKTLNGVALFVVMLPVHLILVLAVTGVPRPPARTTPFTPRRLSGRLEAPRATGPRSVRAVLPSRRHRAPNREA